MLAQHDLRENSGGYRRRQAVGEVLQEVAADMGITPAGELERPARTVPPSTISRCAHRHSPPSCLMDDLDAYREDPNPVTSSNLVTEAALTRPSQPVPMTGMIPQVPNSHAATASGADPAQCRNLVPASMSTTSVPLV